MVGSLMLAYNHNTVIYPKQPRGKLNKLLVKTLLCDIYKNIYVWMCDLFWHGRSNYIF